jgi:hypothetical protein
VRTSPCCCIKSSDPPVHGPDPRPRPVQLQHVTERGLQLLDRPARIHDGLAREAELLPRRSGLETTGSRSKDGPGSGRTLRLGRDAVSRQRSSVARASPLRGSSFMSTSSSLGADPFSAMNHTIQSERCVASDLVVVPTKGFEE